MKSKGMRAWRGLSAADAAGDGWDLLSEPPRRRGGERKRSRSRDRWRWRSPCPGRRSVRARRRERGGCRQTHPARRSDRPRHDTALPLTALCADRQSCFQGPESPDASRPRPRTHHTRWDEVDAWLIGRARESFTEGAVVAALHRDRCSATPIRCTRAGVCELRPPAGVSGPCRQPDQRHGRGRRHAQDLCRDPLRLVRRWGRTPSAGPPPMQWTSWPIATARCCNPALIRATLPHLGHQPPVRGVLRFYKWAVRMYWLAVSPLAGRPRDFAVARHPQPARADTTQASNHSRVAAVRATAASAHIRAGARTRGAGPAPYR